MLKIGVETRGEVPGAEHVGVPAAMGAQRTAEAMLEQHWAPNSGSGRGDRTQA